MKAFVSGLGTRDSRLAARRRDSCPALCSVQSVGILHRLQRGDVLCARAAILRELVHFVCIISHTATTSTAVIT